MIQMRTLFEVADNTGARVASMIGVVGRQGTLIGHVGDIVSANIKEATPTATVKKGTVVKGDLLNQAVLVENEFGHQVIAKISDIQILKKAEHSPDDLDSDMEHIADEWADDLNLDELTKEAKSSASSSKKPGKKKGDGPRGPRRS